MNAVYRRLALAGYLLLLALILIWNTVIAPPERYPVALVLIVLLVPMLFPLLGLLHGRRYTYAWSSMLSLLYFVIGVGDAYSDPVDRLYGGLMLVFSLSWFTGAVLYVKTGKTLTANKHEKLEKQGTANGRE